MVSLPTITGKQLIDLLEKDGWKRKRYATHGVSMYKYNEKMKRNLVTIIPNKSKELPIGTLMDILGQKQTKIGRGGFLKLIEKYGI